MATYVTHVSPVDTASTTPSIIVYAVDDNEDDKKPSNEVRIRERTTREKIDKLGERLWEGVRNFAMILRELWTKRTYFRFVINYTLYNAYLNHILKILYVIV